jgi:Uma2 family endonuclease
MKIVTPDRITPADLLLRPDSQHFELINGQLVERDMSRASVYFATRLAAKLERFCEKNSIAWVWGDGAQYRCFAEDPNQIRRPDVSVILRRRLSNDDFLEDGFTEIAPDIVAEVISPNDVMYDVTAKRDLWLSSGMVLVWIIDPRTKTVEVHTRTGRTHFLRETDTLTAEPVLPGFSLPVAELFKLPV